MLSNPFQVLGDVDLERSLLALARSEREANADIILHLLVVKERKLYVPNGYDSLFAYCAGRLGFSRSTAYRRKAVVDKAGKFPALIDRLKDGRLQLCAAAAVAPHLEEDSATELLDAVIGLSHREVEAFLVKHWRAPVPVLAKILCSSAETTSDLGLRLEQPQTQVPVTTDVCLAAKPSSAAPRLPRTVVRPISAEANRVSITLSDKTLINLQRAKELLGGKSEDDILFRALEKLLDQIAPERRHARREKKSLQKAKKMTPLRESIEPMPKAAPLVPEDLALTPKVAQSIPNDAASMPKTKTPVSENTVPRSRRGRLADRDQVIVEGDCRCTFTAKDGKRCDARVFLEIDHIQPWALGGQSIPENGRPLCRIHNAYFAEQTFGPWSREHRPH